MARIRAVEFDERLTLVEHLDELRSRIFISLGAFVVAFGVLAWQNDWLLEKANEPLPNRGTELDTFNPVTFSPTEPFMTTLTLVAYAALLVSLPIILYQIYAFVLPAFSPTERHTVRPLMMMVPVLFIAGVAFAYFVVAPAALDFLLNFNDDNFDIQIRAREYYSFFGMALASVGILFQIPVGILAVTRLGIITPDQLAENRRYAVLVIAILAMLLPGTDPITMLISMAPLLVLFELSIIVARLFGRPPKSDSTEIERSE